MDNNTKNEALESFAFTYTMRKTNKGWKIIVATIHALELFLDLNNYC